MSDGALATGSVRLLPAVVDDDSPPPVRQRAARVDRAEMLRRVMEGDASLLDELRPKLDALRERCRGR